MVEKQTTFFYNVVLKICVQEVLKAHKDRSDILVQDKEVRFDLWYFKWPIK